MSLSAGATTLTFAMGTALAYVVGGTLYRSGAVTVGTVYLVVNYSWLVTQPLALLSQQFQDVQEAGASLGRIQTLLNTQSVIRDSAAPMPLPHGPLQVDVEHVSFSYVPDVPVLQDVSFTVRAGRVLGLLGHTGSGKTTVTRLLLRLYDPTHGTLRLGGVDLQSTRQAELRARVGLVTQAVQLFQGTVRDNLTFFDSAIPDARILDALHALGLGPWYQALPAGLDTVVTSGGSGFSAGEAQVLAFTRVFLKDPGLVILDEASSRLDPATERRIDRAVEALLRGRSGITVAHRLASAQRADDIQGPGEVSPGSACA
jgi:ATP-binding cassette subfamily B protein